MTVSLSFTGGIQKLLTSRFTTSGENSTGTIAILTPHVIAKFRRRPALNFLYNWGDYIRLKIKSIKDFIRSKKTTVSDSGLSLQLK